MADTKISALAALTAAQTDDTDLLPIVDTSAGANRKMTFGEAKNALSVDAIAAKLAAEASADLAAASASSAAASEDAAIAAAEASGDVLFYDTKAAADAALASLSDLQVVEVFVDESLGSRRTRYRKETGVYVFKLYLDSTRNIYCDRAAGNDSNDGLTHLTPKKTLAAATAMLSAGDTLNLARGSRWFERYVNSTKHVKIRPYKDGNRPIIDGGILASGTWTNDATYTNLWYLDVTFAAATTGTFTSGNKAGAWHPSFYDEYSTSRGEEAGLQRVLNDDVVAGTTVAVTTIAGLLTIANANPGSFTVHKTGSTNYEPRSDNGTQFRFYFYPADASNPNTNGRSVYVVDQTQTAQFASGVSVQDLVIQRTGAKDMVGVWYDGGVPSDFTRVDFLEAACHATVTGGAEFRNCRAVAAGHRDSYVLAGGGFHQYSEVQSRGFKIWDCEIEGFFNGLYSHGTGASYDEHVTFDVDGLKAKDCYHLINTANVQKGVRAKRVNARNLVAIFAGYAKGDIVFEDSTFINVTGALAYVYRKNMPITLRRCFVYKDPASTRLELLDPFVMGTILASEYPTLTLEDSTIIGKISNPASALRYQQNWVLNNSILSSTDFREDSNWLLGTVTASNSFLGTSGATKAMMTAKWAGFGTDCLTGCEIQVFQKTIEAGEHTFYNSTRTATYSGTPEADGTALLTMNYNDAQWSRQIRIVDAYGAGLHYDGYVVSLGTMGSTLPITVYPAPTSAFTSKVLANGNLTLGMFGSSVAATLDRDGAKIEVPDGDFFAAGMYIHIGAISGRTEAFGLRKVESVTGNIITLDRACAWKKAEQFTDTWYNQLGVVTTRGLLPTVTVSFGFPFYGRISGTLNYPKLTVTPDTPTGPGSAVSFLQHTTYGRFKSETASLAIGMGSNAFNRNIDGTISDYGGMDFSDGVIYQALGAAVGDVLKVESVAVISDYWPQLATDPLNSGDGSLIDGTELSRLGIGYKR